METTSWKKQAHYIKLLNQEKVLKLMNRIYIGDTLNLKQINQIMDFVKEKDKNIRRWKNFLLNL